MTTPKHKADKIPKDLAAIIALFGILALAGVLVWLGTAAFIIFTFVWALLQILSGHPSPGVNFLVVFIPCALVITALLATRAHRKHRR